MAPVTLQPGARPLACCPDHVLIRKLGAGAFGEVWQTHGPAGRVVALKFIRLDTQLRALELRSLEVMRNIRHPNLVSLFGAWQEDNWLILAMELCERSLQDRLIEALDRGLPGIPHGELLTCMVDAASGLDALNAQQVQHREVKPANLLLLRSSVKVADFGLAKALEQTVASNSGAGTVAYTAPECFKDQLTQYSDQYSLAVTYYQLRTGRPLFRGNQAQLMYAHLEEEPDLSELPADEACVLARALSKEPGKRWRTCKTFVQTLICAAYPMASGSWAATRTPATLKHHDIHRAARDGDCDTLSDILTTSPARVHDRDTLDRTALDWATQHWQWGAMRLLLDTGARDAELLRPNQGWDAALVTLLPREREVINLRYRIRAKVVYTHEEVGQILQLPREKVVVLEGEAVDKLLRARPSLAWLTFLQGRSRHRPRPDNQDIHRAARQGDLEAMKAILAARPDRRDEQDVMGRTPLTWAFELLRQNGFVRCSHYAVMLLLMDEYGARPTDPLARVWAASRAKARLERQQTLTRPLNVLRLSNRAMCCLEAAGIVTVGELTSRTALELLEIRGLEELCLHEVREGLARLGLKLSGD
jgi:hypothetical protein